MRMDHWKELILQFVSVITLVMASVAILLIEFWGVKKIWRIVISD